jgi:arsenite methyltransferase
MAVRDPTTLRDKVRTAYSAASERPQEKHAFPVGPAFAESLGYPKEVLDGLPRIASDAFAGVSNVSVFAEIPSGATILDLGCGAGLDALIAARRVGPAGKVIAVDFSTAMLARARQAVAEAGVSNLELREADAEQLPIKDGEVDVAMVNGIFNLNPARRAIFRELARIVRRGGTVFTAELILSAPLASQIEQSDAHWFA